MGKTIKETIVSKKSKVVAGLVGASALALAAAVPAAAAGAAAGEGVIQEVLKPASGACADYMSEADINWSGVGGASWADTFGDNCIRTFYHDNSTGLWFVR